MNNMNKFSEIVFKLRGGIWTALFLGILFFANEKPLLWEIILALALIILGQLIRFWAVGTIGLYRGEHVKAQSLATTGAYSIMRNPLYFGNFLIGLGWSFLAGWKIVIVFVISFWVIYVMIIIPHEENFLTQTFGAEYIFWKRKTGMFFPKSLDYVRNNFRKGKFNREVLFKSETHSLITTIIGTLAILAKCLCYT